MNIPFLSSLVGAKQSLFPIGLDYATLLQAASRSKMAYYPPETVQQMWEKTPDVYKNEFEKWIYPQLKETKDPPVFITSPPSSGEDAQAYVWKATDGTLYLVFRGTSSKQDALADLDVRTIALKNGARVHIGFYEQFLSVEPLITEQIEKSLPEVKALNVAGHSLGSALSQIAAAHYGEKYPSIDVSCYTFGCPRTGDVEFTRWFRRHVKNHVRVANENDPVPMIPQRPVWCHTNNTGVIINDSCDIRVQEKDIPWYMRIFASLTKIDFLAPIQDHDCDLYISRLSQIHSSHTIGNTKVTDI